MSRPHVIFASVNRRFLEYAQCFLKTLQIAYPEHPEVHLYHTDLNQNECSQLSKMGRVKTVKIGFKDFKSGPAMASHHAKFADPRISYSRFLIWTRRFEDYETVVHLDTDLIVRGSLEPLFHTDKFLIFPETYTGKDAIFYNSTEPKLVAMLKEDGIAPPSRAANAGIFSVPRALRTEENFDQLMQLIDRYDAHIKWSDQSILNLWMAKKGIALTDDFTFNFQHRLLNTNKTGEVTNAKIFHLNGVDLAYRLFLMKALSQLHRSPGGWTIYKLLDKICQSLLKLWRKRPRA